jgi:CheY-like chemotaxis protein
LRSALQTAQGGEQALLPTNNHSFDLILADDKMTGTQELLLVMDLIRQSRLAFVLMIITVGEKTLTHGSLKSFVCC